MASLRLDVSGLETEATLYAVPSLPTPAESALLATLKSWTGARPEGAIHSGYRRQILAREGLAESRRLADEWRARFDTLVVLGIGGSALGARMALNALMPLVPNPQRRRVLVLDNLDPLDFESALAGLDWKRTGIAVVTKTGGTIETLSQSSEIFARLTQAGGTLKDQVVAITDPTAGALRAWSKRESTASLALAPDVGGRFSMFTPVGLFPIAFGGIDIEALMKGAVDQFEGREVPLEDLAHMAKRLAELEDGGFTGHVFMPYASVLKDFGAWFVQLWGESLGKIRAIGGTRGMLPLTAVGATDQHSLLQMLVEGPNRVMTGFLTIENWDAAAPSRPQMRALPAEFDGLAYARGKSFGEILNGEATATRRVLRDLGRPTYELKLARLEASTLGALSAFYMDLTVLTAAATQVNPFDQPGVELGKKLLPAILKQS